MIKQAGILALFTGFVVAQGPATVRPDQSQQTQPTQPQAPDAQQPRPETQTQPSEGQTSNAGPDLSQIQGALRREPGLSNVIVNTTGNRIELSGTVNTRADKDKARSIAESSAGGLRVVNKIHVIGANTNPPPKTPPNPQ